MDNMSQMYFNYFELKDKKLKYFEEKQKIDEYLFGKNENRLSKENEEPFKEYLLKTEELENILTSLDIKIKNIE